MGPLPGNDEGNAIAFAAVGDFISLDAAALTAACDDVAQETGIKWGASMTRLMRAIKNIEANTL